MTDFLSCCYYNESPLYRFVLSNQFECFQLFYFLYGCIGNALTQTLVHRCIAVFVLHICLFFRCGLPILETIFKRIGMLGVNVNSICIFTLQSDIGSDEEPSGVASSLGHWKESIL